MMLPKLIIISQHPYCKRVKARKRKFSIYKRYQGSQIFHWRDLIPQTKKVLLE